jgi:hypothetical protein
MAITNDAKIIGQGDCRRTCRKRAVMRSHIFLPTIPVCRTRAVEVSKATDHCDVGLSAKIEKLTRILGNARRRTAGLRRAGRRAYAATTAPPSSIEPLD